MKAILKSKKAITEIIAELKAEDAMFYKAEGSFQGDLDSPLFTLQQFDPSVCGYTTVKIGEEMFHGWVRSSGVYCFVGEESRTVVCYGTRHSLYEIFHHFGIDENSEVLYVESQSTAHPAIVGVRPDLKQQYDDIARYYRGMHLYNLFREEGLSITKAKQFGY